MSRTYRRRKDKVPEWVISDYKVTPDGALVRYIITDKKKVRKEISKWRSDAGWHDEGYGNSPSWWIHEMMEVPLRARLRNKLKQILKLYDYEDADIDPHFKKPYDYYW